MMNDVYQPAWTMWFSRLILAVLLLCICVACGAAGAPIAPEDVGLEVKIREQQQTTIQPGKSDEVLIPLEEERVILPALHPVGTR